MVADKRDTRGEPFQADLVGQPVRLRGLPQAPPHGPAVRQKQGHLLLLQGLPVKDDVSRNSCTADLLAFPQR